MAAEQKIKPIKPDEEAFKANLMEAEKELSAVQEKMVWLAICPFPTFSFILRVYLANLTPTIFNPNFLHTTTFNG